MTTSRSAKQSARFEEVDIYRGIAVIGVVFSHAVGGLRGAGLVPRESVLWITNDWLYQFRMPAIALVLGLFISYGVDKYGTWRYIAKRAIFAIYLYLIWYVIQMGMELATSQLKNHPITVADALRIWSPPAHLWYIPYIAVSALVIALLKPWTRAGWVTLPILVLGSTALWGWSPPFFGLQGLALVGFSALGATIGVKRFGGWLRHHHLLTLAIGAFALMAAFFFYGMSLVPASVAAGAEAWEAGRLSWLPASAGLAWLGQFIVAGLSVLMYRIPYVRQALVYVGQQTLPVYLMHIIIIAGLRIVLMRLGVESVPLLMTILMVAGVGIPVVFEWLVRRTALGYMFNPPNSWLPAPLPREQRGAQAFLTGTMPQPVMTAGDPRRAGEALEQSAPHQTARRAAE